MSNNKVLKSYITIFFTVLIVVASLLKIVIWLARSNDNDASITFSRGEVLYTANVVDSDAKLLTNFLDLFLDGSEIRDGSFHLDKQDQDYIVCFVSIPVAWETTEMDKDFEAAEYWLQTEFFTQNNVVIEVCDSNLQTHKRIDKIPFGAVVIGDHYDNSITFPRGQVYYSSKVVESDSKLLVNYLDSLLANSEKTDGVFLLDRRDQDYIVRFVSVPIAWETTELDKSFESIEYSLQTEVFIGKNIIIELCDSNLKTHKVIDKIPYLNL